MEFITICGWEYVFEDVNIKHHRRVARPYIPETKIAPEKGSLEKERHLQIINFWIPVVSCRVPKGGVFKGGGNWGTLRIRREDWGTLGKIREPPSLGTPPLKNPIS